MNEQHQVGAGIISSFFSFSVVSRVVWYVVTMVPFGFILLLFIVVTQVGRGKYTIPGQGGTYDILGYLLPVFLIIMAELIVQLKRKKLGLGAFRSYFRTGINTFQSFDGNMFLLGTLSSKYDEWVAGGGLKRVNGAMGSATASTSVDKDDLGYWYGLLQSGAITQAEYDAKKRELI